MSEFDSQSFWGERWAAGRLGFHRSEVHPVLLNDGERFLDDGPHRVLVPLCGKSWDVPWLADQGHTVTGVEIVRQAIDDLFAEHDLEPRVEQRDGFEVHTAERIEVWCADFLALPEDVGPFTRVWDRAAIVAVLPEQRGDYVEQLRRLAPGATLWLTSIDYDPGIMDGPPFAVPHAEIEARFANDELKRLQRVDLAQDPTTRWAKLGHRRFEITLWSMRLLAGRPSNRVSVFPT
ncbi:MAG: thiopurine S-methyltransferase [Myxococcota bacterium]